ncbi:2-keto-4-pentenoate hydratase [Bradyrhizobium sp. AZCC 2289]|uniref:2-keto-4-pentenoate hydratase n=1 Tax=Bradyrhizobium sp. AZCC 2289 TaxID=3117026 RepID=UPI002FEF2BA9
MVMSAEAIDTLAKELVDAREARSLVTPPSSRFSGFGLADAYAVGAAITAQWVESGRRHVVGQKIGLTFRETWERIGIDRPVWAPVYDQGLREEVGEFSLAAMTAPKVEIEVVLGFERPVPLEAGREEIAAAVGWAALGYEIVDCHYPGWKLTPPDMVADFGCHAGLFIGRRRHVTAEQVFALSDLTVTLRCDGEEVAKGDGWNVLGGPVHSVHAMLACPEAASVRAGDVISTGALSRGAYASASGRCWTAQVNAGPSLEPIKLLLT